MNIILDLFSFAIPMIILSWLLPKKYVLLSQILITGLFIWNKSPISLGILTFITVGNYYVLHYSNFSEKIKIGFSLFFLIVLIFTVKIVIAIDQDWIVPLGISYYSFRNIHYTLEYYKGKIKNESWLFYFAYNFFLPVFIVGPINRYPEFVKDWRRRRFDVAYISTGLQRILFGTSKIIIVGNYLLTFKAKLFIENTLLQEYADLTKSIKTKENSDESIHKENFIKFLSDSRDWAFSYIENVQKGLTKFVNDVDADVSYFDEYGDALSMSRPDYPLMKNISKAYKESKTLLPEDEIKQ